MLSQHTELLKRSGAALNVYSSLVRASGRGLWAFAIPSLLSVPQYAIYSIWQTTTALISQLGLLGLPQVIMREPRHSLPIAGLVVHSCVLMLAGLGLAYLVIPSHSPAFYLAAILGAVFSGLALAFTARAKGAQRFASVLASEAAGSGVLLVVGIPLIFFISGDAERCWIAIAIEVAAAGPALFILTMGTSRLEGEESQVRTARRFLAPVYSVGFLVLMDALLWRRIEVYFLGTSPDALAAISAFSLATQFVNVLMVIPGAVTEAWYPTYAAAHREDPATFEALWRARRRTFTGLYSVFAVTSIPACVVLVKVWFTQYEWALVPILCIIASRVLSGYTGFYTSIMYATGGERWIYLPVVVGALSAIIGNAALTLSLGLDGLVIAYAITHVLVAVLNVVVWRLSRRRR